MPSFQNEDGLPFTAASVAAVDAFDRCIHAYALFRRNVADGLKETLTLDPAMPMALVLKGCFLNYMGMKPLQAKAAQAALAAEAAAIAASATPRELLHIAALKDWSAGDYRGAIRHWEHILRDHPRDFLSLKLANYLHFYVGDSAAIRDSVNRVLPAWSPGMAHYHNVRTLLAFGLEETGDYAGAESLARASIAAQPLDTWAVHAVAHVMEAQSRFQEGIQFLAEHQSNWETSHNFRYHLWWHRALFHIGLQEFDQALAIYDTQLWDPKSDEYLDLCNDISLLMRLELAGLDVGARWEPLLEKTRTRFDQHVFAFVDAHFMMALSANRAPEAAQMLRSLHALAATGMTTTAEVTRRIGIASLRKHRSASQPGNSHALSSGSLRVLISFTLLGGSHTQRDLFRQIIDDAAANRAAIEQGS